MSRRTRATVANLHPNGRSPSSRVTPLARAVALVLATAGAGSVQAQQAFSPAWFASKGATQSAAASTAQSLGGRPESSLSRPPQRQQVARERLQRSIQDLNFAARMIAAREAAQVAARRAALNAPSDIPDGLVEGGLKIDTNALSAGWSNAKAPVQTVVGDQTTVLIEQTADKAILNWETFNVGRNTTVRFEQNADWSVLNRVNDPQARPSEIHGSIQADGQVYLINRNGIVFGGTSQVNTRSLVASALAIHGGAIEQTRPVGMSDEEWERAKIAARDQRFIHGLVALADPSRPVVSFGEDLPLAERTLEGESFDEYDGVVVEAGAHIRTGTLGQVLLMGHNVINRGTIETPDGQALLAAGRGVSLNKNYLDGTSAAIDPDLRGYTVGVDRGGRAENDGGLIIAERGNITLTGHSILQSGVLSATTGAEANGSILLKAVTGRSDNNFYYVPRVNAQRGEIVFAPDSITQILPDDSGTPVIGAGSFRPSKIDVEGKKIIFQNHSRLRAPGAEVRLLADAHAAEDGWVDSRIYLGEGAVIDVSGLRGVAVDMEQNVIEAELRANELRDNPLLKEGALRGETVYFDLRYGEALLTGKGIANLSGYYDLIERDVAEFMTAGGTLTMSGSEIIARAGSLIDLSGGSVEYQGGYITSTVLIDAAGRRVPIEFAPAGIDYVALDNSHVVGHPRWQVTERYRSALLSGHRVRWEDGYTEGRSGGSLILQTSSAAGVNAIGNRSKDAHRLFEGDVRADVVAGRYQTEAPGGSATGASSDPWRVWRQRPRGATLEMGGYEPGTALRDPVRIGGNLTIAPIRQRLPEDFQFDSELDPTQAWQHVLPAHWFDGHTFAHVTLYSGYVGTEASGLEPAGILMVGEGVTVDLGDYGSFDFYGRQALIDGVIRAANGTVHLETAQAPTWDTISTDNPIDWADVPEADRPVLRVGATGAIDVSGRWINDWHDGVVRAPSAIDGGQVTLVGHAIELLAGSRVDVSGGGHLDIDGRTLTAGDGGAIVIDTSVRPIGASDSLQNAPGSGRLVLAGELAGYALGRGGSLTIDTPDDLVISEHPWFADGVLDAGIAAPKDLELAEDTVLPVGTVLLEPVVEHISSVAPGEPLGEGMLPMFPLTAAADWHLPPGVVVYTPGFGAAYGDCAFCTSPFVPAGATIANYLTGELPVGYVVPAEVFPDGLPIQPISVTYPVGPLERELKIPAGTRIPQGMSFLEAVQIRPLTTLSPEHFRQGGFAEFALSGARGLTVAPGTVIAPQTHTVILDDNGRDIATGSRLVEAGRLEELPEMLRQPMSVSLSTVAIDPTTGGVLGNDRIADDFQINSLNASRHPGGLTIGTGAEIRLDSGSRVRLLSLRDAYIDGTIDVPGGAIETRVGSGATIRLGAEARLLARGHVERIPDGFDGQRRVAAGGDVTFGGAQPGGPANRNNLTLLTDARSVIDVSGIAAIGDFIHGDAGQGGARYASMLVDGAAGAIAIQATDGGVLAGSMHLAPGGAAGRGGELSIITGPVSMRQSLSEDIAAVTPSVTSETMTDRPWQGMTLFADRINASGVDDLYIETGSLDAVGKSALLFDGDVTLSTRGSIRIGTALLGMHSSQEAAVNLESAYIGFNSALPPTNVSAPVPLAQTATADLTIRADLIDLFGQLNLGCGLPACVDAEMAAGFDVARFESTGDIRLAPLGAANVGLYSGGGLVFDAAQVYTASQRTQSPTSNNHGDGAASYPGFVIESAQSVEFIGNGAPAPTPLSFGERLTVRAPVIVQGGVLRAPQGQVRLEATESVTLLPGSLTSASLDGLTVPFGEVAVGGLFPGYGQPGWTPEKSVRLSGPEVNVAAGAVLDVSGGGDLLGWSFSPGNGGSNNILAFAADTPRFAILPSLGSAPAPIHPSPRSGANPLADVRLSVGDTIWLADVPGLAPGYYTLLPAHYALLDGGLLIEPMGGATAGPLPSVEQPDGSLLVSGYRARGDQGRVRDPAYGRFKVMTRRVIEQYSEISRYSFNEYAKVMGEAAGVMARTPSDAGSLVLAATETLRLEGTGRFGVDEGGLLGNLDIAAQRIAITAAAGQAPEGYLSIDATELSSFGAGSILVGGSRSAGATGTAIEVSADSVIVDNDAGSPLTGLEFIFAANEDITVGEGAYIVVSGAESLDANTLELNGDGALMRVSAARRVGLDRTAGSGHAGDVRVHGGADVSGRSISLEGSRTIELSRDARLDAEEVDLASMRVNLGNVPEDEPGVTLGLEMLERLGFATDLLIRGHESIQLHGSFELGARGETGPTLGSLTLDTARLRGRGSEVDTVGITAGGLVLRNSGAAASPTDSGSARLALDVDSLRLESGEVRLTGFEAIQGSAGAVVIDGRGSLVADGALSLSAGRITSGSGADYALHVGGDLRVERGVRIDEGENASPTVDALGGRLAMSGASLSLDTAVVLPAGTLSLTAASGNLTLGDAAMLDLSGVARDFRDVVKFAPGGRVELTAAADVVVREGAVIDVSGSDRGGPSGRLGIEAGRAAIIRGTLQATTVADRAGGEFALDAGTIDDFSALNAQLNAGGFDAARAIRVRTQDLTLAAGERIDAHTVTLRSDEGAVRIAGTIAAGGSAVAAQGGDVRLIGGSGVVLESTARIEAAAAEVDQPALAPSSGTVELVATSGRVDVADGALVDVSGGREGGGRIVVRAERTGDGLAVGRLDGEFRGARARSLVGVASYEAEEIDAALAAQMLSEATGWLSDAAPVPEWTLGAGMRVRSTGDLRVGSDVDLAGQIGAGWLGLEAAGDLHIDAAISDGFADSARDAALLTAPSAGYDFESGGDLVVGAGGMIRTGTGDIRLDVGRNLVLADNSSVIYTAGAKTAPRAGFDLTSSRGLPLGEFATLGGDIVIDAGGDIRAPVLRQSASAWLFRYGETDWNGSATNSAVAQQTSWSVVYKNFESGIGTLGGGDVQVRAGRDIEHLSIALPTTGHLTTPVGQSARAADLEIRGGGNLELDAGRDLLGGSFLLGRGQAVLTAGRDVVPSDTLVPLRSTAATANTTTPRTLGAMFGLMDATVEVVAGGHVEIEGLYDPMLQGQVCENLSSAACFGPSFRGSSFHGYSARAAFEGTALGGRLTWRNEPYSSLDVTLGSGAYEVKLNQPPVNNLYERITDLYRWAPGTLKLTSMAADVEMRPGLTNQLVLAPSEVGTFEVLARGDVRIGYSSGTNTGLLMVDMAPEYRRGALHPFGVLVNRQNANTSTHYADTQHIHSAANNFSRGFELYRANDPDPVRIYALEGSVCQANLSEVCTAGIGEQFLIQVPKALDLYAGMRVSNGSIRAQHNDAANVTRIVSAGDINDVFLSVAGGGAVIMEAGRHISFNTGGGVVAVGDTPDGAGGTHLALPRDRAASLHLLAGASEGVDYEGFAQVYLDPDNAAGVVRTYRPELAAFMAELGYTGLNDADLDAAFAALPAHSRHAFLGSVLFSELKETGLDYNDPESPRFQQYTRGYDAVERLFTADPQAVANGGDIILNSYRVETRAEGDISIMAPYGRIEVGSPVPRPNARPEDGGVVTRRGGSIRMMADDDIALHTSRVFTLQGGDILMWTSNGDITAGAGAKTSVRQVPLIYAMSNDGMVSVNVFGLQTGAGIGVLDALQGESEQREKSRMDLLAFRGEVNAGDAGIRVIGDLNIAALRVVGAENIQVSQGESTGMPDVAQVNVSALTNASAAASQAATAAQEVVQRERAAAREALPSVFTVRVVNFGDEATSGGNAPTQTRERAARDGYDWNSPVQVLGSGALSAEQKALLTEEERRNLQQ